MYRFERIYVIQNWKLIIVRTESEHFHFDVIFQCRWKFMLVRNLVYWIGLGVIALINKIFGKYTHFQITRFGFFFLYAELSEREKWELTHKFWQIESFSFPFKTLVSLLCIIIVLFCCACEWFSFSFQMLATALVWYSDKILAYDRLFGTEIEGREKKQQYHWLKSFHLKCIHTNTKRTNSSLCTHIRMQTYKQTLIDVTSHERNRTQQMRSLRNENRWINVLLHPKQYKTSIKLYAYRIYMCVFVLASS